MLQRRLREAKTPRLAVAVERLTDILENLTKAATLDDARGYEGAASAAYFAGLGECFAAPFVFLKRTRRPPEDPLNALLSFGYTMLFENIYGLVEARGLSPYIGTLHVLKQGHPALCLDLIEEFRAPLVDALVTTVINKKIFSSSDFRYEEYDREEDFDEDEDETTASDAATPKMACRMSDEARKKFVAQFEKRIRTKIYHKRAGFRTSWCGCIDLQIAHYIRVVRGEDPHYIPMEFV